MESATELLKQTLQLAKEYDAREHKKMNLMQSHAKALEEDMQFLLSFREPNKLLDKAVADLLTEARAKRRDLDRQVLEITNMSSLNIPPTGSAAAPTSAVEKVATAMQLPQVKLPSFNGDPATFRIFYDTFVETVQKNSSIPDMTKWVHLQNSLLGPASELVKEIPRTPATLSIALKMLHDTYGSEEKAVIELYGKLQATPQATMSTQSLRLTYAKTEGILMSLEQYGHDVNCDGCLRSVVLSKYPSDVVFTVLAGQRLTLKDTRTRLGEYIISRESTFDQIAPSFVAQTASNNQHPSRGTSTTATKSRPGPSQRATPGGAPRVARCIFCGAGHWSDQCTQYPSIEERKNKITDRCHKCLRAVHTGTNCTSERRCFHCDAFDHNRAFCPAKFPASSNFTGLVQAPSVAQPTKPSVPVGEYWTLMTSARQANTNQVHPIRVLVDPGSPRTLVTKQIAEFLQLKTTKTESITFYGMNNIKLQTGRALAETIELNVENGENIHLRAHVINHIAGDLPAPNVSQFKESHKQYADLHFVDPGCGNEIDMLLGGDNLLNILRLGSGIEVDNEHQLLSTVFGHIIVTTRPETKNRENCFFTHQLDDIKLMCELDTIGLRYIEKSDEKEELDAIKKFYETIKFIEDRYEVAWPWRYYPPLLDVNYGLAIGRLRSLHRKLKNKPEVLREYHRVIMEQVKRGIAEPVTSKHSKADAPLHYLPHHPIIKADKSTTVRPVYDASTSGVAKGSSLNQNMLKGTKWLTDLVNVLLRFRDGEVGVISDIERAFHQIAVREQDRDVVRFVWLRDPEKEPTDENIQIYRFTRVAFGIVSSPFLLSATIHYHAEQQPNEFTPIIKRDLYADNLVTALPSHLNKTEFYEKTKTFFKSMGMNLTKWSTNDAELRAKIPTEDQQTDEVQSVLGLRWNVAEDLLRLKKPNFKSSPQSTLTKRRVLSQSAAVYDPLGWASPITLTAKIFIRKLWEKNFQWDEKLQAVYEEQWKNILGELDQADKIQLQRKMFPEIQSAEPSQMEIHSFVDASAEAVAVVVYAVKKTEKQVQASFVASKNRLSPHTKLTIPRLELLAVLLGCRFTKFVVEALGWANTKQHIWSDSTCALSWIGSERLLPPILQKQVAEIKKQNIDQFNYVPTELNRADVASRGSTYLTLQQQGWWTAPTWLKNPALWPKQQLVNDETVAAQEVVLLAQISSIETAEEDKNTPFNIEVQRYEKLSGLLRQTACCINALHKLLKKVVLPVQTENDYNMAKLIWLRWDQKRFYKEAVSKPKNTAFAIKNMRVFIDDFGILRCLTRIEKGTKNHQTSCPILLAKNSHFTKLIILNKHEINFHAGTAHTLAAVRKTYWLPQGRRQVYAAIAQSCYKCKRQIAQTYPNPPAALLPEARVTVATQPFEGTALDICGPFAVRTFGAQGQSKQKRWIIVFTCTRIRAVHLETLNEMTTREILDSFRRFVARRGTPRLLISDNATQFHCLNGIFQQLWPSIVKSTEASEYFATNNIQWKFLPPESPWMGGVHERVVQMVKTCLERTYGDRIMLDRQFVTTVTEIEGVINARPLTYVDQNLESPLITPNHFLNARFNAIPLDQVPQHSSNPLLNLWKSSQKYIDEFWQYWAKMYILELRERDDKLKGKPRNTKLIPAAGEIVLVAEPEKKRSSWSLALIERLIRSEDNVVRSVQLRLPNRTRIIRPVIKIAPLGISTNLPGIRDEQLNASRTAIELPRPEGVADESGKAGGSSSSQSTDLRDVREAGEPSSPRSQGSGETEIEEIELNLSDWEDDDN